MKEIFEEMEEMGWNQDYANENYLSFDLNNLKELYTEIAEGKLSKTELTEYILNNDILGSLGFILDFVDSTIKTQGGKQ